MTEPIELLDPEAASTDRFARLIAVAAVLATLAAAVVGYLESQASKAADRADVDAQQLAVRAFSDLSRSGEQAQVQYGFFVQRQAELRRASSALEETVFGTGESQPFELERARFEKLADQTAKTARRLAASGGAPVLDRESADGPDRDGVFPARYFSKVRKEGIRLTALRDAANEEGAERGGQVASYIVMLTMLAVAVYLFGFSLTPHGRANRRLFAGVAAGLSLVAGVWALVVSVSPPERAPDEAAAAFAAGSIANGVGDYDKAVRDLDRAIELRPSFARAYQLRADAEFARGSPQPEGLISLTVPESLERAVADQEKARELGLTDVGLLNGLGFNTLLLGLEEESQDRFEEAIQLAKEAEGASPRNPIHTLNRAVAELAAGDEEAARESYRRGVEKIIFIDPERRRRRNDSFAEEGFVAGALTDLELAGDAHRDEIGDDVRHFKEYVVRSVTAHRPLDEPQGEERVVREVEVEMTPATARVDLPAVAVDTDSDRVSLQWYRKEGELGWAVLQGVSGPVEDFEWTVDPIDGSTLVRRDYLTRTDPPSCLPTAEYRVEIYVNGRLAGVGKSDPTDELGDLTAATDTDIGYRICHPPNWRPLENALPGLVNGYTNADSTRGVFVARVTAGGRGGDGSAEQRGLRKLETVLGLLSPDQAPQRGPAEEGGFAGLEGEQVRRYTFNDGDEVIRAGYGFDVNGALLTAIVFGEPDYMESDESYEVLNSVADQAR
jgi:tetratricopeptide (TPR) repeat protein